MIVRIRPAGVDDYGDPIDTPAERTELDGCFVAPRSSDDIDARGRQGVIVGLSLYGPWGTDIRHPDQIEDGTDLFQVVGEPGQWKNPLTGWEAGFEVALERAAG